ncbi:MAG: xanthine dehydrogenase family protein molybdopterin-binding subunit [Bryobacteraceae bacterium]|nr:xanthine dehydrogenase family protein molybdopterin-binding subunit [Bryobacteraceae bacterium]
MNPKPWGDTAVVGKPVSRIDAYERLSGAAIYSLDVLLPDMLHAAILRCPHAHAIVKKVDASAALAMPGVRAVLTDADQEARIPWHPDAQGKPVSRLFDPHCRCEGEEVAAVAAETPQQAADALRRIRVEYETRPFVIEMEAAHRAGATQVHDGGNYVYPPGTGDTERGDVAKGFAEADVVLEETYRTSCEIHTTMEVHGSVAKWDGKRLTVWNTTQGVFDDQAALAAALKMPLSDVRVIGHYMGGGFGSKLNLGKYTVIAALFARKTGRPVKLFLSREETFLSVGNRPAHTMKLKAGVRKDGTLTALELNGIGTVGAYTDWTTVGYQVADLYLCPNVRVKELQVYTHAGQSRPFRAPGFPQCSWALEQMMDALAEKIGMDPVEFRLKNIAAVSQAEENKPYTSTGFAECLREGARVFGWRQARERKKGDGAWVRGAGMAGGMWGYAGGPPSTAIVRLYADGSVNLNIGASDLGTGTKTVMAMVVAEELGVPLDRIQIESADTATTQYTGASGGSKTVMVDSPAVRAAALEVKAALVQMAAGQLQAAASGLSLVNGEIVSADSPDKRVKVQDLKTLKEQQVVVGVGRRGPNPAGKVIRPFAAQFAEVEVNTRTGEMRVLRMAAAHDSGRVMNRLTYENQVFGGMTMGIGLAMTEQRILDRETGKMVNANWHDYKIPTMKDAPADMTCVAIDPHDHECDTTSTKGLGEPAMVPTAAAVANAFYHATGVRMTSAPITPAEAIAALSKRRKG